MSMHVVDEDTMHDLIMFAKDYQLFTKNRRRLADCLRESLRLIEKVSQQTRPGCCCSCHTEHASDHVTQS